MPRPQHSSDRPEDRVELEDLPPLTVVVSEPTPDQPDPNLTIPFDDVTHVVEEVNQPALKADVQERVNAVLRQARAGKKETTAQYNERVKREFTEQVMAARRAAAAPPPPPQPMAPAMVERTRLEMEAGRRQSAYWAEQQKLRPPPSARDIAAAGSTTAVFQPTSYTHEKGEGYEGKQYSRTNLPGR